MRAGLRPPIGRPGRVGAPLPGRLAYVAARPAPALEGGAASPRPLRRAQGVAAAFPRRVGFEKGQGGGRSLLARNYPDHVASEHGSALFAWEGPKRCQEHRQASAGGALRIGHRRPDPPPGVLFAFPSNLVSHFNRNLLE